MISRFGVRLAAVAYRSVQSAFVCASPEARRRDESFARLLQAHDFAAANALVGGKDDAQ